LDSTRDRPSKIELQTSKAGIQDAKTCKHNVLTRPSASCNEDPRHPVRILLQLLSGMVFSTCQVRVSRFYQGCFLLLLLILLLVLNRELQISVGTAGPQPGARENVRCQIECQQECQNICRKVCKNRCRIECQIECQSI